MRKPLFFLGPDKIESGYVEDWQRVLVGWLGWTESRFERFVRAFNAKIAVGGRVWFYHEAPLYHMIRLLVRNEFDDRLCSNMRRPQFGAPEWTYFHSEMQGAIEGGEYYTGDFDWAAARERALKHLETYGETFPPPGEVTNYEKWILSYEAS